MTPFSLSRYVSSSIRLTNPIFPLTTTLSFSSATSSADQYWTQLHTNGSNIERTLNKIRVQLDTSCVTEVLQRCATDRPLLGLRFFIWAGLQPNYRHSSYMYYKACNLFKLSRNPKIFNDVMEAFRNEGCLVSVKTFKVVLNLCREAKLANEGLWVLRKMKEFNCHPDTLAYNVVIRLFCEKGDMDEAAGLMREMGVVGLYPDMIAYVAMVKGFVALGRRSKNPNTSKFHTTNGTNDQPMDLELHEAAKNGNIDIFITILEKFSKNTKSPLPTIFSQLTPQQDTFLHVAASYGHEELTGFIAHHFGHLIVWKNCKGDSALHLAARAGHFGLVEILLSFRNDKLYRDSNWDDCLVLTDEERVALIKQRVEERVLVNDEGNTALHEALINDHKDVAEYLMTRNIEAAYYVNKQGKSPLYMAVEAGKIEYVKTMLRGRSGYMTLLAERSKYMDILDKKLTKGKSLLHAAIKERSIGKLTQSSVLYSSFIYDLIADSSFTEIFILA